MGPNHHHHHHSHRNSIEGVSPIKGATSISHGIAPVLVISIMTRRSRPFVIIHLLQSNNCLQVIIFHSGYVVTYTVVKVVSTLTESMPYVDSGLLNNQRLHFPHRSVLLHFTKVRFHIKISYFVSNQIIFKNRI